MPTNPANTAQGEGVQCGACGGTGELPILRDDGNYEYVPCDHKLAAAPDMQPAGSGVLIPRALLQPFIDAIGENDFGEWTVDPAGPCDDDWKLLQEAALATEAPKVLPAAGEDIGEGNRDCLAKRRPGEPMFILLGRDPDAHNIVRMWAERRLAAGGDPEHCNPVVELADRMRVYAADPANAPASAPPAEAYLIATPAPAFVEGGLLEAADEAVVVLAAIRAAASDPDEWQGSADHFHKLAGTTIRQINAALQAQRGGE